MLANDDNAQEVAPNQHSLSRAWQDTSNDGYDPNDPDSTRTECTVAIAFVHKELRIGIPLERSPSSPRSAGKHAAEPPRISMIFLRHCMGVSIARPPELLRSARESIVRGEGNACRAV